MILPRVQLGLKLGDLRPVSHEPNPRWSHAPRFLSIEWPLRRDFYFSPIVISLFRC